MLSWAFACFFTALVAMLLGFPDVAGMSPEPAWVFVVLAVAVLVGATSFGRAHVR